MENRKLKQQLVKHEEKTDTKIRELKLQLKKAVAERKKDFESERKYVRAAIGCVLPVDLMCPADVLGSGSMWSSQPFYDHIGGDKLQLKCYFTIVVERRDVFLCFVCS